MGGPDLGVTAQGVRTGLVPGTDRHRRNTEAGGPLDPGRGRGSPEPKPPTVGTGVEVDLVNVTGTLATFRTLPSLDPDISVTPYSSSFWSRAHLPDSMSVRDPSPPLRREDNPESRVRPSISDHCSTLRRVSERGSGSDVSTDTFKVF